MLTQNYTGLACLAVSKLQSGLCQLFGTKIKMKTKKITAGSVILIASLLNSIPESSASPDINPWIGKSANSVPEDCQGPGGHLLQQTTAFQHPVWLPNPSANCSRHQNNGLALSWSQSSLVNRVGWKACDLTVLFGGLCLTYCLVTAVRSAWTGFSSWANLNRFTSACSKHRKTHFSAQGRKQHKLDE